MAVSSSFNYPFVVDIKKEFQSNILRHTFTQCCEHSQSFISHLSLCGCFVYDFSYYYGRHHHHRRRRCCLLSSLLTLVSSLCACICRWLSHTTHAKPHTSTDPFEFSYTLFHCSVSFQWIEQLFVGCLKSVLFCIWTLMHTPATREFSFLRLLKT